MNAYGQHGVQYLGWRLHVWNAIFVRPRTEPGNLFALTYSDGAVLMPGDLPVGFGSFVEQKRAYRKTLATENRLDQLAQVGGPCKGDDAGQAKQSTVGVALAFHLHLQTAQQGRFDA